MKSTARTVVRDNPSTSSKLLLLSPGQLLAQGNTGIKDRNKPFLCFSHYRHNPMSHRSLQNDSDSMPMICPTKFN